jgi:predicted ATPase
MITRAAVNQARGRRNSCADDSDHGTRMRMREASSLGFELAVIARCSTQERSVS